MRRIILLLNIIIFFNFISKSGRSVFRPKEENVQEIITNWVGEEKTYHFCDSHLEEQAIFDKFDKDFFFARLLPKTQIKFRNANKSVSGQKLHELAQNLLKEIFDRKKQYTNFKILKNKDFNIDTASGLLILKYKDYPFVLKLFMENPESFVKPFSKGWQPSCLFIMSGGINRFLSGFTRIKNLEAIKEKLDKYPEWSEKIDLPKKWYWIPEGVRWFNVRSKNIGEFERNIQLPAVYGIIADAINSDKKFSVFRKNNRKFAMDFSYFLENRLDPHIDNFMLEKETGKIVIVDTEHFPSMVGLKNKNHFKNYSSWFMFLSGKCFKDKFCRDKKTRNQIRYNKISSLSL